MQVPVCVGDLEKVFFSAVSFLLHSFFAVAPFSDPSLQWTRIEKAKKTYSIGTDLGIFLLKDIALGSRDVNHTVDDRMRHVHPLRPELLAQTLRQRSQGEFARREGRGEGGAADGCGGAGEK